MPYRFPDREIINISTLIDQLGSDIAQLVPPGGTGEPLNSHPEIWFRGLEEKSFKLIPTFHTMKCRMEDEVHMMNLFKQNAHESIDRIPGSEWEWMFLMRHHGIPSRLLDWTESPIIGLYFSIVHKKVPNKDGVLWCLLPHRLNELSINWPQASESLPMFTSNEDEWPIDENRAVHLYLPSTIAKSPLPRKKIPPVAGINIRTTRRIQAQMGVFTIHHLNSDPLEYEHDRSHVWRYIIPKEKRVAIENEFNILRITKRIVFPDLDSLADEINKRVGGT